MEAWGEELKHHIALESIFEFSLNGTCERIYDWK